MKKQIRLALTFLLVGISAALTLWGFWPPAREVDEIPLQGTYLERALPEARTLRLEFSPTPRRGDSQNVELRIAPEGETLDTKNIYSTFTVVVEARLDMPLAEVRPSGVISAPLTLNGSATFYWEITPRVEGEMRGTVWSYLRYIPLDGGAETRQAVAAQMVAIRPRSVLGRGGSETRLWGIVGLAGGVIWGLWSIRKVNFAA